jgi:hypothetical protein
MVTSINEFLFPVFLFIVYVCTVSVFVHHSRKLTSLDPEVSTITTDNPYLKEQSITESTQVVSLFIDHEKLAIERIISDVKEKEMTNFYQSNDLYIQTEKIINNLSKRQSRKLCKLLGIQQKCGKIEKSLTFIKAEVRSLFKENPERVIAAIQEKLPELISITDQSPYIDEKIAS